MRTVYVRLRFLLTFAKRGVFDVLVVKSEFQYALKMKISRVPDLGQGKNEWVREHREFGENLALLTEEFKFWSFPDYVRSRWFHAINAVIDVISRISINLYLI